MGTARRSLAVVLALIAALLLASHLALAAKYTIADLGTLGGTESFPHAINDRGQVVGSARLAGDAITHAFLYTKGAMADLAPLNGGQVQTAGPTGINNASQIASGVVAGGLYVPAVLDSKTGEIRVLGTFGGVSFGG